MINAAFQATYKGVRTLATGSLIVTLEIENPKDAQEAFAMLGMPNHAQSKWVAVALLDTSSSSMVEPAAHNGSVSGSSPLSTTNTSDHNSMVESILSYGHAGSSPAGRTPGERARIRSVLLCKDREFMNWIGVHTEQECRDTLCHMIEIDSRSELAISPESLERFLKIETTYLQSIGRIARSE